MSLFVTARLDQPVLETAVERAPESDVAIEQRTMTGGGALDLTVCASGGDLHAFEAGLDDDGTVSRWVPIGRTNARKLYRIRLTERASSRVDCNGWTDGKAVFLPSRRTTNALTVNAFLEDRSVLQRFATRCESNDVSFDLLRASEVDEPLTARQFGLTELQAETLLAAFERGFYSVPREVTLEELAASHDVSHQALSERLRRGVGSLISSTIADRRGRERWPAIDDQVAPGSVTTRDATFERPIAVDP